MILVKKVSNNKLDVILIMGSCFCLMMELFFLQNIQWFCVCQSFPQPSPS